MNSKIDFSVVIPTFNHAHLLGRCLQSLLDQTYPHWEAIVVDNYSVDNTIDVVKSFSDARIKLIQVKNDGIIAASRNAGVMQAKSQWICFLDSDDWWYPKKLETVLGYVGDSDVIYHKLEICHIGGEYPLKMRGRRVHTPVFEQLLLNGNAIPNSSSVIRKTILENVGHLTEDKTLTTVEDFDLWLKIAHVTDRFYFINKTLGAYWIDGKNASLFWTRTIERINTIYEKHCPDLPDNLRTKARATQKYQIAYGHFLMGENTAALPLFRSAFKDGGFIIRFKAFYRLVVVLWKMSWGRKSS